MYVFSDIEWQNVTTHHKIDLSLVTDSLAVIGVKTSLLYHLHFLNVPIWVVDFDMHYLDDLRDDNRFTFIPSQAFIDGSYLKFFKPRKQYKKIILPVYPSLLRIANMTRAGSEKC